MTFPAITADNQFTIQNDQPFWSKDGKWRKHKGVYQCQEFYNATAGNSTLDLQDYLELPRPINFIEIRGAFIVSQSSQRFFFDLFTHTAAFSIYNTAHAFDFQGAMFRGGSMWGNSNWRSVFQFESNGFPMNWGDGGWPCDANTPAVAYVQIHAADDTTCVLTWTCVFINSGNVAVVKGHGTIKLQPNDFKGTTFWLNGGHSGGSITLRYS